MTNGLNPKKCSKKMLMMWRNREVKTWDELKIIKKDLKLKRNELLSLSVNKLQYENIDDFEDNDLEHACMYNLYEKMVNQICKQGTKLPFAKNKLDDVEKGERIDLMNRDYLQLHMNMLKDIFNISDILNNNIY